MTSMHEVCIDDHRGVRLVPTRGLRIATYNVYGVVGVDGKFTPERIAVVLAEIDAAIFALREVPLGGNAAPDVLAILQRMTGLHAVAGPTLDTPARRYSVRCRRAFRCVRSVRSTCRSGALNRAAR